MDYYVTIFTVLAINTEKILNIYCYLFRDNSSNLSHVNIYNTFFCKIPKFFPKI